MMLAALLFIYDASQLLAQNEAILTFSHRGWRVDTGKNWLSIRGRNWVAVNFLLLHRPSFKLCWDDEHVDVSQEPALHARLSHQAWLVTLAYGSWLSVFVALPYLLFFHRTETALLICSAAIYLFALVAGGTVLLKRSALGLSEHKARTLALELFLCPPFTANLVRRITLLQPTSCNLVAASVHLLGPDQWGALRTEMVDYLDLEIDAAEFDPDRMGRLRQSKKTILEAIAR